MGKFSNLLTPFNIQCFTAAGVILNMAQIGLEIGYTTSLLPQLQRPDSSIPVDDSSRSWIAAMTPFGCVPGIIIISMVMGKFGRRVANITSIALSIIGWLIIAMATNVTSLYIARLLQGFSITSAFVLAPVIIGEYVSPKNRGAFLTTMSLAIATGTLCVQTIGLYMYWQTTALICACFTLIGLLIVIYSPESPMWFIDKGRYEEARKVFRYLRGDGEEDELSSMIEAHVFRKSKGNSRLNQSYLNKVKSNLVIIRKKEFYKPILIVIHLLILDHWSGLHLLVAYMIDLIHNVIGNVDKSTISTVVISVGVLRLISSVSAVYIIKKVKRRTMLIASISLNICVLFTIAAYSYAKSHLMLPFDHVSIGIILINVHMISVALGPLNLAPIIAGELFPLEYRSLASAICGIITTPNVIIIIKTAPFLFKNIGLYGAYCLYGGVVSYCFVIACVFLPETKDKTLQSIEDEIGGKQRSFQEQNVTQPLGS